MKRQFSDQPEVPELTNPVETQVSDHENHFRRRLWLCLAVAGVFVTTMTLGAEHVADSTISKPPVITPARVKSASEALKLPSDFSLRDKIGQLLVVGVTSKSTAVDLEQKYQIGGFLLRPNSGLYSKTATSAITQAGKLPPLLAVDQEGGEISRLGSQFGSDSAKRMGGLPTADVRRLGDAMGKSVTAIGANVDFAPVADLDNGRNAAIGMIGRSFSSDPAVISVKAAAFAQGLRQAGVLPTFKHFPGLGRANGPTNGNTDTGPATTPPLSSLEQNDLLPYQNLLQTGGLSAVMVGNQIVPGLTAGRPASLSAAAYTLLRDKYDFQQVVFTDELILAKAVSSVEPSPASTIIDALKAGADMPLFIPDNEQQVTTIINAVGAAVHDGRLSESRIDQSLSRVLLLKGQLAKADNQN